MTTARILDVHNAAPLSVSFKYTTDGHTSEADVAELCRFTQQVGDLKRCLRTMGLMLGHAVYIRDGAVHFGVSIGPTNAQRPASPAEITRQLRTLRASVERDRGSNPAADVLGPVQGTSRGPGPMPPTTATTSPRPTAPTQAVPNEGGPPQLQPIGPNPSLVAQAQRGARLLRHGPHKVLVGGKEIELRVPDGQPDRPRAPRRRRTVVDITGTERHVQGHKYPHIRLPEQPNAAAIVKGAKFIAEGVKVKTMRIVDANKQLNMSLEDHPTSR